MTRKIAQQSNLIDVLRVLACCACLGGCLGGSRDSSRHLTRWGDSIVVVEGVFARESCNSSEFALCNSGFDIGPRLYPLLIDPDASDLRSAYAHSIVYVPMYGAMVDSLEESGVELQFPWDVDSALEYASKGSKKLRIPAASNITDSINALIQRNGLSVEFSGFYSFDLLKVRMRCLPVRSISFSVINFRLDAPSYGVFEEVDCAVMQIVEILELEAVPK